MRHVPEIVFWVAACTGTWLLTLSSVSTSELVTGPVCALPCAVLAVAARYAVRRSWRPRIGWLRWLLPLPVAVVADTGRVLGVAARALLGRPVPSGQLRTIGLPHDRTAAVRRARQAAAVLLVTAAPGTLVIDIDPEDDDAVLHALGDGRPHLEEAVRR
jgi:multisubunit Na+/H+ antiporter MnhE subunit